MGMQRTLESRFWEKVDIKSEDECWEWQASTNPAGYGLIWAGGRLTLASRICMAMHLGMFDQRLHVMHKCDNPPCVNPAHLTLGTRSDNMMDRVRKGKYRNGAETRTHCRNGHEYTEENTYSNRGWRECRTCRNTASLRSRRGA